VKALRLSELRALLQEGGFTAWWADYGRALAEQHEVQERRRDLLAQAELMELRSELVQRAAMDAFSDGGTADEAAAKLGVEAQEQENRALELVALFEEQRFRARDLWYRLGGAERSLEESADTGVRGKAERQLPLLQKEYAVEDGKRTRLWTQVEETWSRSFERSLLSHEHGERARHIRRDAERLFKEAEERRQRARQLKGEAEAAAREAAAAGQRLGQLLERAAREFGCLPGERFLYWHHRDDQRLAFAVPLQDDADGATGPGGLGGTGGEVKALTPYLVGPQRGVARLEPALQGAPARADEKDRRFEEYLLGSRPGIPGHQGGSGSGDDHSTP